MQSAIAHSRCSKSNQVPSIELQVRTSKRQPTIAFEGFLSGTRSALVKAAIRPIRHLSNRSAQSARPTKMEHASVNKHDIFAKRPSPETRRISLSSKDQSSRTTHALIDDRICDCTIGTCLTRGLSHIRTNVALILKIVVDARENNTDRKVAAVTSLLVGSHSPSRPRPLGQLPLGEGRAAEPHGAARTTASRAHRR